MILAPRYDGPTILSIDGDPSDQLVPICRQHRRLQATLERLTVEQWDVPSRCEGWCVRDVAAHLVDVNSFWSAPVIIQRMSTLTIDEVLAQFVAASEKFLTVLEGLGDDDWSTVAESPAGHVPICLLTQHALWDSWIHERDIVIPLDITPVLEEDEVRSCLRYAAA